MATEVKLPPSDIDRYNTIALVMPDSGSLKTAAILIGLPSVTVLAVLLDITGIDVSGGAVTVKSKVLVAVSEFAVTEILPLAAPGGTVVVMLVAVDAVTVAAVPLKLAELFDGVVLKLVPVMVTVVPTSPLAGAKPVMVGGGITTVKSEVLMAVREFTVTEILPVEAPGGTVVVMLAEVDAVTVAAVPLKATVLFAGVVLKLVPVIVTIAPTTSLAGAKPVMVGAGVITVKSEALVVLRKSTETETLPVVAPTGTVVVMLVAVDTVTVARVPLKVTTLSAGVVLKLVPVIVTVVPTIPLEGLKELVAGINCDNGRDHKPAATAPAKRLGPHRATLLVVESDGRPVFTVAQFRPSSVDASTPLPAPAKSVVPLNTIE
jgi:hypothetical protein